MLGMRMRLMWFVTPAGRMSSNSGCTLVLVEGIRTANFLRQPSESVMARAPPLDCESLRQGRWLDPGGAAPYGNGCMPRIHRVPKSRFSRAEDVLRVRPTLKPPPGETTMREDHALRGLDGQPVPTAEELERSIAAARRLRSAAVHAYLVRAAAW